MTRFAILIACESYKDREIPDLEFADSGAVEFGQALALHGFDPGDQRILVGADATRGIVESRIRKLLRGAAAGDTVYFFYAGHAFSMEGANYLTCHDTLLSDLHDTSIPLTWLLTELGNSPCQHIALFIDATAAGLLENPSTHGQPALHDIYADLVDEELEAFLRDADQRVGFVSCRSGEVSWRSGQRKHGIWAWHLIEAFRGDAPRALEGKTLLTSTSLQSYLAESVPRSLRKAFADPKTQTPWMAGGPRRGLVLADLADVQARKRDEAVLDERQVARVSLTRIKTQAIRSLSGFKKGRHQLPDAASAAAESFVAKIAAEELNRDMEVMHRALKAAFGFRRADLDVSGPEEGSGSIITPYFTYHLSVGLSGEDPTDVAWRRQVTDIKSPQQVFSDEFAEVFAKMFDTLEFSPPEKIDVEALIDRIEGLDDGRLAVDYDREATACTLSIEGVSGVIKVTGASVKIVKPRPTAPKQLVQSLLEIQRLLSDTHGIRSLSFDAASPD